MLSVSLAKTGSSVKFKNQILNVVCCCQTNMVTMSKSGKSQKKISIQETVNKYIFFFLLLLFSYGLKMKYLIWWKMLEKYAVETITIQHYTSTFCCIVFHWKMSGMVQGMHFLLNDEKICKTRDV